MATDNMAPDLTGISPVGSATANSSAPDLSEVSPVGSVPGAPAGAPDLTGVPVAGEVQTPPKDDVGALSKAWAWATKGLLGRDAVVDLMGKQANFYSLGQLSRFKKDQESWSQFIERMRTTAVVDPLEEKLPWLAATRVAAAGMVQSAGEQGSSFTSPVSLAMLGAGTAAKIPGAIGTLAKVGTGLATAEFGREGLAGAARGVHKMANAEYGGPGGWISEGGAEGLNEVLGGLGGAAFATHGMAEQLSAPAKRYVNAVRESAAKITGGLEARGRGVLSERALEIQDAAAAKMNVEQAITKMRQLGVIDQATHDTIADLARTSPDKAARVLQDKLSGDALGNAAPKADLTNNATQDGRLAFTALSGLNQEMRRVPEIKAMLEESTDTIGEHLAKNLNGDVLDTLRRAGNGETAELLSKVAENNVHRQAQALLDTGDNVGWLKKLKSGYDKLNTGIRDSNPEIEKNAQTVNGLLRLRNTIDAFQKQFPKTDYVKFALDALTAKSWKAAGAMLLGGIFGHSALGIGGAGIMGIKWAATRTPVIRAMTNAMGSLHEALSPKVDVPTTVGVENGTVEPPQVKPPEPQVVPHQEAEATVNEAPTVQPAPTEPQTIKPGQGPEIAGTPVEPAAPGPGETPAAKAAETVKTMEPSIAAKAAEATAALHGKDVSPTTNAEPVESAKASLAQPPAPDRVMEQVAENERANAPRPEVPPEIRPAVEAMGKVGLASPKVRDTVVKDENGNPLTVYHGTQANFDSFERRTGMNSTVLGPEPVARHGFFFTPDRDFAEEFKGGKGNGRVVEASLAIKNPLDLRDGISDDLAEKLSQHGISKNWLLNHQETWERFDGEDGAAFVEALKKSGYDGAIIKEPGANGQHTSYVAFSPDQIKTSAPKEETPEQKHGAEDWAAEKQRQEGVAKAKSRPADPRATGTPEEKADFVKEFRDKHPEAAQHGMTDQEILDTESRGKYESRSVKGETEEAAKAEAEKRGGKWEPFKRKYNISPQLKAGTWGIRAPKETSGGAPEPLTSPETAGKVPAQETAGKAPEPAQEASDKAPAPAQETAGKAPEPAPGATISEDPLYDEAVAILKKKPNTTPRLLQLELRLGEKRANRLFQEIKSNENTLSRSSANYIDKENSGYSVRRGFIKNNGKEISLAPGESHEEEAGQYGLGEDLIDALDHGHIKVENNVELLKGQGIKDNRYTPPTEGQHVNETSYRAAKQTPNNVGLIRDAIARSNPEVKKFTVEFENGETKVGLSRGEALRWLDKVGGTPEFRKPDANPLPGTREYQVRVGIHEAIHGLIAHLLGLRVRSIGRGVAPGSAASISFDYNAVPRTPKGTSNHLTALAAAQADPYLTTLSGGVAGELHAGYDTTLSRNSNPNFKGTDAWKFYETAKSLGITAESELKELWNYHVQKAKYLLQEHKQALPKVVQSLNDRMDGLEGQGYELDGNTYRKYVNEAKTVAQTQDPVSWGGDEFHKLMEDITGKEAPGGTPKGKSTTTSYMGTPNVESTELMRKETVKHLDKLDDVARELDNYTKGKGAESFMSNLTDRADMIGRAVEAAVSEARYHLKQAVNGQDWYKEDLGQAMAKLQEIHPELKDPKAADLFKLITAVSSSGQGPAQNLDIADQIYNAYKRDGKIPAMALNPDGTPRVTDVLEKNSSGKKVPTGEKKPGQRSTQLGPRGLETMQRLIDDKGVDGAVKWAKEKHPVSEVMQYAAKDSPWVKMSGDAEGNTYGSLAFGPKVGRFFQNLTGNYDVLTADRWFSRTWNRWMGTSFDVDKKGVASMPDGIRNPKELAVMQESMGNAAKELNMNVAELQATLWYYEKSLWRKYGHNEPTESYSGSADRLRAKRYSGTPDTGGEATTGAAPRENNAAGKGKVQGKNPRGKARVVSPDVAEALGKE